MADRVKTKRERTFIMVKPDAVQRGLIHKVIIKLEKRGFKLIAMKFTRPGRATFEAHYIEHKGKPFYEKIVLDMMRGPVCAMIWEGDDVVATSRTMIGATNPQNAAIGTFRGDYGLSMGRNSVHGSDSDGSAHREIGLWFKPDEICTYKSSKEAWVYEKVIEVEPTSTNRLAPVTKKVEAVKEEAKCPMSKQMLIEKVIDTKKTTLSTKETEKEEKGVEEPVKDDSTKKMLIAGAAIGLLIGIGYLVAVKFRK